MRIVEFLAVIIILLSGYQLGLKHGEKNSAVKYSKITQDRVNHVDNECRKKLMMYFNQVPLSE